MVTWNFYFIKYIIRKSDLLFYIRKGVFCKKNNIFSLGYVIGFLKS